jgi:hypothetical protein
MLSWNVGLEKGYEPRVYPYAAEEIPLGQYETFLEFKIGKKSNGNNLLLHPKKYRHLVSPNGVSQTKG